MCRAFLNRAVPLFKPRFSVEGGKLQKHDALRFDFDTLSTVLDDPTALQVLEKKDYFFPSLKNQCLQILRRYRFPFPSEWSRFLDAGVEVTSEIFNEFIEDCVNRDVIPVVLVLPVYWGGFPAGEEIDRVLMKLRGEFVSIDCRKIFTKEKFERNKGKIHHRFTHYTRLSGSWISRFIAAEFRDLLK